jgi:membrane associated rhomboid family serine protease
VAGGTIHGDPALVTKVLLAVNVAVFVLDLALGGELADRFAQRGIDIAVFGEQYRLISGAFLHAGLMHLAFNMLALWFVGGAVEAQLGRWRYLSVYLLSALGGAVLSYAVDSPFQATVGASGAVFGLFGAWFALSLKMRLDVTGLLWLIGLNAVIGFVPGFNINWRAHLGGLIVGAALTAVMVYAPQRRRFAWSLVASVAMLALLVGIAVNRSNEIRSCDTVQCVNDLAKLSVNRSAWG